MVEASPEMQKYFEGLKKEVQKQHSIASKARKKSYDPLDEVEIKLAENMAERVVGLISVIAPQIAGTGIVKRIIFLEKQYGTLDWRVALQVALEVAQEKFCKFKDKKEAMEIGIRTGFAYSTVGVVSSP
ncbi:DNA polymerase II large subunit, partial [Candidatus Woesearchaeota archaeon]|nr:DNA polymerase II large subunit [Candidatus Woesearchaeota archaeon]